MAERVWLGKRGGTFESYEQRDNDSGGLLHYIDMVGAHHRRIEYGPYDRGLQSEQNGVRLVLEELR